MNEDEEKLARFVYRSIQDYARATERSLQAASHVLGVSDLGHCQEYARRMLIQEPPSDPDRDFSAAFMGMAVGDYVEQAVLAKWPGMIRQASIKVHMPGTQADYEIDGHPDLISPLTPGVFDVKTVDGFERVKRKGPTRQQLFQRHLYALGAHQEGLLGDVDINKVRTANIWIDRSGSTHEVFVHMDYFRPDIIAEATEWMDDVLYAVKMGEEARKEPHRSFCEQWCIYYSNCRAHDTDVTGLIDDPAILSSVDLYLEGVALQKQAKEIITQAQAGLKGVTGSTGKHTIRWTWVNGGHVAYERQGYDRLNISKLSAPKENHANSQNGADLNG